MISICEDAYRDDRGSRRMASSRRRRRSSFSESPVLSSFREKPGVLCRRGRRRHGLPAFPPPFLRSPAEEPVVTTSPKPRSSALPRRSPMAFVKMEDAVIGMFFRRAVMDFLSFRSRRRRSASPTDISPSVSSPVSMSASYSGCPAVSISPCITFHAGNNENTHQIDVEL